MVTRQFIMLAAACLAACGAPEPPRATGGTDVQAGPRGRGFALVMSDYQSTNIALLDSEGKTLSGSFLSSASAPLGLSVPLSGDVVLPNTLQLGPELVFIDRYPAALLTIVDVATASVTAQIDVGTEFRANPQDVLVDGDTLWVSRYETNPKAGASPFDEGGDVLIVDRTEGQPVARVDLGVALADEPGFWPRPGRMVTDGDRVFVLLAAYDSTFQSAADSRLVVIDIATRKIVETHVLTGLAGCAALAIEPPITDDGLPNARRRLVVGCSGRFNGTSKPTLFDSGLALLEASDAGLVELRRWAADALFERPVGFDLALDGGGRALVATLGHLGESGGAARADALVEVELDGDRSRIVLETAGRPFELGGVRCASLAEPTSVDSPSDAGAACLVADGSVGVLWRLERGPDGYVPVVAIEPEHAVGLPPRWLGRF